MDRRNYQGSWGKFEFWEWSLVDLHLQMGLEQGRKDFQWKQIPLSAGDVEGYILHYLTIARNHIHFLCKSHFSVPSEMFYILGQL